MNEVTIGHLGSILPELILAIAGLLILLLDTIVSSKEEDRGSGYMLIAIVALFVALAGAILQFRVEDVRVLPMISIDKYAVFMKVVIFTAMALVAVACGNFMNQRVSGRGEFWSLFLFVTVAMSFAVMAVNLLLIFLAVEFLSITSYLLVGFLREQRRSTEAGLKYFLYGSVASAIMLYGFSFFYGASGSLSLPEIAKSLADRPEVSTIILPATLMGLVGLGFKTSLVPFHQWAPDVYDGAPTPITAYLSTASKATGFAVMGRVLITGFSAYQIDWVPILTGLAILTMTVGNLIAIRQTSVKRMLAYSSIAQAGYILMGLTSVVLAGQSDVTALSMDGLNGMLVYLFAYAFTNIGAFLVVLAVEEQYGNSDLSTFRNLGQRSPALAWAMFFFLLSLTGIPLTAGFVGKFFVFGPAVEHGYFLLVGVAAVNVAIAAYYYLNVVRAMFFPSTDEEGDVELGALHISIPVQVVVFLCLAAVLWIGIYPPTIINWATAAAQQLLTMTY